MGPNDLTDDIPIYWNYLGDSFLHRCFLNNKFLDQCSQFYTPILGWSEPFPLIYLIFVLLIIFPTIFRFGQFQKASRIYSIIRLSLLSLFHQTLYSYTLVTPISLLIRQDGPCISVDDDSILQYNFPCDTIASSCIFLFMVTKLTGMRYRYLMLIWFISLPIILFLSIIAGFTSLFQGIVTILFIYLVHMWHINLPFKFIHIENALLFIMNIIVFLIEYITLDKSLWKYEFYIMWFPIILPVIDEVLLFRHHITRGDFSMIEKPKDLRWMNEEATIYSIRLLSSLEEEEIAANVKEDLFTSIFCFIIFFSAVTFRVLFSPYGYFFG